MKNTKIKRPLLRLLAAVTPMVVVAGAIYYLCKPEPASEELCSDIFHATFMHEDRELPTNWPSTARRCSEKRYFDKLLPLANTKFTIVGNALTVEGRVYSTRGMWIRKDVSREYGMPIEMPAVKVKLGNAEIEMHFATQAEADSAFQEISAAISRG